MSGKIYNDIRSENYFHLRLKEMPTTEKVKRNSFGIEQVVARTSNESSLKEVTCAYTVPL